LIAADPETPISPPLAPDIEKALELWLDSVTLWPSPVPLPVSLIFLPAMASS
jgi:hypothetical protein